MTLYSMTVFFSILEIFIMKTFRLSDKDQVVSSNTSELFNVTTTYIINQLNFIMWINSHNYISTIYYMSSLSRFQSSSQGKVFWAANLTCKQVVKADFKTSKLKLSNYIFSWRRRGRGRGREKKRVLVSFQRSIFWIPQRSQKPCIKMKKKKLKTQMHVN